MSSSSTVHSARFLVQIFVITSSSLQKGNSVVSVKPSHAKGREGTARYCVSLRKTNRLKRGTMASRAIASTNS